MAGSNGRYYFNCVSDNPDCTVTYPSNTDQDGMIASIINNNQVLIRQTVNGHIAVAAKHLWNTVYKLDAGDGVWPEDPSIPTRNDFMTFWEEEYPDPITSYYYTTSANSFHMYNRFAAYDGDIWCNGGIYSLVGDGGLELKQYHQYTTPPGLPHGLYYIKAWQCDTHVMGTREQFYACGSGTRCPPGTVWNPENGTCDALPCYEPVGDGTYIPIACPEGYDWTGNPDECCEQNCFTLGCLTMIENPPTECLETGESFSVCFYWQWYDPECEPENNLSYFDIALSYGGTAGSNISGPDFVRIDIATQRGCIDLVVTGETGGRLNINIDDEAKRCYGSPDGFNIDICVDNDKDDDDDGDGGGGPGDGGDKGGDCCAYMPKNYVRWQYGYGVPKATPFGYRLLNDGTR